MAFVPVNFPHPLFLVLTERCLAKSAEDYVGIPLPKSLADVESDLLAGSESGIWTLVDDKQPENVRISFCTTRYELVCGLTQQGDAFFVQRLLPLSLRTHNLLARGAVLSIPQTWGLFNDLSDFNSQLYGGAKPETQPTQTGIADIQAAWQQIRQPVQNLPVNRVGASVLVPAELSFLANIDTLIDLACQLELEKAARQDRTPVRGLIPQNGERYNGNICRFQLVSPGSFRVGDYLRTGTGEGIDPGADGVVTEVTASVAVLRFRLPLGLAELQRVQWLAPQVSTRQYKIQHEAVTALRNGESLNPALLPMIVDNQFEEYDLPVVGEPSEKLNLAQRTLVERALVVPDMLVALGPPGTGKTETIRAIIARQALLGKKVLVTSKNNKAVDNVLAGLGILQALRIGREEVVTPSVRPLLIDQRAVDIQQEVLVNIQPVQADLDLLEQRWSEIQKGFERLTQLTHAWRDGQAALDREISDVAAWQRSIYLQVEPVMEKQLNHYHNEWVRLNQALRRAESLRRQLNSFQHLSRIPLLGQFFILWAGSLVEKWQGAVRQVQAAQQQVGKSRESSQHIWEAYRQYAIGSQEALLRKQAVLKSEADLQEVRTTITMAQADLLSLTENLSGAPAMQVDSPAALSAALREWRAWAELSRRRKALLSEWRELLQSRPQVLYPALIRSADVIGATCIGIATDVRFEDLDFDLVIADEAGQIQVMDLLVPLVRARRALLVGDHMQLPPVVEPEIITRIRETEPENRELGEWLEKSLFERMIEKSNLPDSHRVMLDTQYRMPRQIADFISTQFYAGQYQTGLGTPPHVDPFFQGNPLVFIDTMKEVRHYEQRAEDGQGYSNTLEARLICELFMAYQAKNILPGVIVPYKKQAEVIRRELHRRQPDLSEDDLISRVATVDSFQGREQDVILFSFTRSNSEGRIGFLTELRRLNVSLTRARRQLVLVGDSITLTETADLEFASLAKALLASVKQSPKGYFYSNELTRRLLQL